jgi:arsenite oxidase small subunit
MTKRCDLLVDANRWRFLSGASLTAVGAAASAVLSAPGAEAAVPQARVSYPINRLANIKDLQANNPMDVAIPTPTPPAYC